MLHVGQELLAPVEHMSSPSGFSGIRVAQSLVFCVMLYRSLLVLLAIALSVPSSIYVFLLPRWYLRFTSSYYPVGILDLRRLITPLVSYIYGLLLPRWYLRFTASYYLVGILDLRLLITPLVSSIFTYVYLDIMFTFPG
jgi:hypothetical protein